MKNAGILAPVASLPGRHGIGDFGNPSFEFINWLRKKHFDYWQVLPLNPLGPGNSPYLTTCSYALDFIYISLDELVSDGLLNKVPSYHNGTGVIRYEAVRKFKLGHLKKAYENYVKGPQNGLKKFKTRNSWVFEYATFTVFSELNDNKSWNEWKISQRDYFLRHRTLSKKYLDKMNFVIFLQYIAQKQWKHVLAYAHERKIKLIGDLPFYVGFDSVDCWLNRDQFLLDEKYNPRFVGGVPPDYFSKIGQRWGNPIYDFEKMKIDDYAFLIKRIGFTQNLYDIVRLDHFRAFDTYYLIPIDTVDATIGEWKKGPGAEFFDLLYQKHPSLQIIAEDLGLLVPSVYELRDKYKLPGMNVVQFTLFDPHFKDDGNLVVYSGTHDNETLWGWYKNLSLQKKKEMRKIIRTNKDVFNELIKYILNKPAKMTILPIWDYLSLGNSARLNIPGTVGSPNFEWKLRRLKKC
ncbi:MAG: 4-alpha-glucanotransferase [Bacilli bacterium]|jgi:4-alpha-glucanotransferase|nr:4-alpha-glucanotransferase [Bacilli bacterium]